MFIDKKYRKIVFVLYVCLTDRLVTDTYLQDATAPPRVMHVDKCTCQYHDNYTHVIHYRAIGVVLRFQVSVL